MRAVRGPDLTLDSASDKTTWSPEPVVRATTVRDGHGKRAGHASRASAGYSAGEHTQTPRLPPSSGSPTTNTGGGFELSRPAPPRPTVARPPPRLLPAPQVSPAPRPARAQWLRWKSTLTWTCPSRSRRSTRGALSPPPSLAPAAPPHERAFDALHRPSPLSPSPSRQGRNQGLLRRARPRASAARLLRRVYFEHGE